MLSIYKAFFKRPVNQVAVVIPVHKESLDEYERASFQQCLRVLSKHTVILLTPEKFNVESFLTNAGGDKDATSRILVKRFSNRDFASEKAYNKLLVKVS